jgi:hypothetical protein
MIKRADSPNSSVAVLPSSVLMSIITTRPPIATIRRAAPKPKPDTPPVINATEPSICNQDLHVVDDGTRR